MIAVITNALPLVLMGDPASLSAAEIQIKNTFMKLTLPPKITKTAKALSIIVLVVTVIASWSLIIYVCLSPGKANGILVESSGCNVAKINLYGEIYTYIQENENCSDCVSSEVIVNQIRNAEADDSIKAILLNIDSSGGSLTAGQEIANALKLSPKPTVALIRDSGTSAAYFAATGADIIFASDMSNIGSIGVTSSYLDNSKKNQAEGLTFNQLSMGKYKDMGNRDKPLTAEERALWLADTKIMYDIFINNVAGNRQLDVEKVKKLADGNTMLGQKAMANGLIDQIGDIFDAEIYISSTTGEDVVVCR